MSAAQTNVSNNSGKTVEIKVTNDYTVGRYRLDSVCCDELQSFVDESNKFNDAPFIEWEKTVKNGNKEEPAPGITYYNQDFGNLSPKFCMFCGARFKVNFTKYDE